MTTKVSIHLISRERDSAEAECARIAYRKNYKFLHLERRDVLKKVVDKTAVQNRCEEHSLRQSSGNRYKLIVSGDCEFVGVFLVNIS